jgi:hypothetical protein
MTGTKRYRVQCTQPRLQAFACSRPPPPLRATPSFFTQPLSRPTPLPIFSRGDVIPELSLLRGGERCRLAKVTGGGLIGIEAVYREYAREGCTRVNI